MTASTRAAARTGTDTVPAPLLQVTDLTVRYPIGRGKWLEAVSGVSLDILEGETLGVVGESGCGKSTVGKSIVQLHKPASGTVSFDDQDLTKLSRSALRQVRPHLQMIFQDPISSLNPRRKVFDIVEEPLKVMKVRSQHERSKQVVSLLEQVGINPDAARERTPSEFSGGQCQRISIARALAMRPKLIICDEPVSALDVSVQAQVLNLLEDLKLSHSLTLMFISHDLAVVKNISDRVIVMYLGRVAEVAPTQRLYDVPAHPYTMGLLNAIPDPDATVGDAEGKREGLSGELPSPSAPPSGCRFRTRCPLAREKCASEEPQLREVGSQHQVACHYPLDNAARETARLLGVGALVPSRA
jgi:peptide/nickel transport system ATP-binding protein